MSLDFLLLLEGSIFFPLGMAFPPHCTNNDLTKIAIMLFKCTKQLYRFEENAINLLWSLNLKS